MIFVNFSQFKFDFKSSIHKRHKESANYRYMNRRFKMDDVGS